MHKFDLIIVGAGPAGIFTALEIVKMQIPIRILLLEKGMELDQRKSLICGWGGSGAYSDGKLTLTPEIGGYLKDLLGYEEAAKLIAYVDQIYLDYGAPKEVFGEDEDSTGELARKAAPVSYTHLRAHE